MTWDAENQFATLHCCTATQFIIRNILKHRFLHFHPAWSNAHYTFIGGLRLQVQEATRLDAPKHQANQHGLSSCWPPLSMPPTISIRSCSPACSISSNVPDEMRQNKGKGNPEPQSIKRWVVVQFIHSERFWSMIQIYILCLTVWPAKCIVSHESTLHLTVWHTYGNGSGSQAWYHVCCASAA